MRFSVGAPGATALVFMLSAFAASSASAQNCTASGMPSACAVTRNIQLTVRRTVRVIVSPSSANLGTPTADDFQNGYSEAVGHSVTVKSNNAWTLSIRSTQGSWSASGGARTNKPRADLLWSAAAAGPFNVMSGTLTAVAAGTATSGTTITFSYRILWSWALDRPGGYTLPIQLTVAAQ